MYVGLIFAVLYGVPLVASLLLWSRFIDPTGFPASRLRIVALAFATLSVLWGFASLAYVYLIRPMPRFDHTMETIGIALSVPAVVAAFCDIQRPQVRVSTIVLAISSWTLFLWMLQVFTS